MALPRDRGGLARHLSGLCAEVGAQSYLLFDPARKDGDSAIVACNWVFDAVRATGLPLIRRMVEGPCATVLGQAPRLWQPVRESTEGNWLDWREAGELDMGGHAELAVTRIRVDRFCVAVIFSADVPGKIDAGRLTPAHLSLSYVLSALAGDAPAAPSPVSERERECLAWVSEGKTADEIATIVGVAASTVNSYVNHAIRKLSARNRAMAIATAIRAGVI